MPAGASEAPLSVPEELPEDALDENYNLIREKDAQFQTAVEEVKKMMAEEAKEAA